MAQVKKRGKREVQAALCAWIPWTPLLALFAVMAADATLSLRAREADYEFGTLAAQRRQAEAELDKARATEAEWNDIRRVADIITRLSMLPPDPSQIQVVVVRPDTPMPGLREGQRDAELEMASGAAPSAASGSAPVVGTAPAVALPVMAASAAPSPAVLEPVDPPQAASAPPVAVASHVARPPAVPAAVLAVPNESITDLDTPEAPINDLLANL